MSHKRTWRARIARDRLTYIAARYGVALRAARNARAAARGAPMSESASETWRAIAHAAQLPPQGAWSTWLFQGGRGAGKTRAGAEWLAERAEASPNGVFALVGPTQHDVREVMIGGESGLLDLPGRAPPRYEPSRRRLIWPNGAIAYAFSAEEPSVCAARNSQPHGPTNSVSGRNPPRRWPICALHCGSDATPSSS